MEIVAGTLVVGYVRVSTDEQSLGPAAQRSVMDAWCTAHRVKMVAVYEDIGISGGAPLDKRPGIMAALAALSEHGATVLLVAKRDRIARDGLASAMVERMSERAGARILTADGSCNGDGPEGLLMRRMVDAFAEYERALIRARTKAALAEKKKRGERVGSVPYGSKLADDSLHLVPDKDEQKAVTAALALRAKGMSLRKIGRRLTERGMVPRSGGAWHPQAVARILKEKR